MEVLVLDEELNTVGIVDTYTSLIWTDRYNEAGDFELYLPVSKEALNLLQKDRYLYNPDSKSRYKYGDAPDYTWSTLYNLMIIEDIRITTDIDEGNNLKVTGRSLESILERRIIWKQTNFESVQMETVINTLLNQNAVSPSISARAIPNLKIWMCRDEDITSIMITKQFMGETLYDAIKDLCQEHNIGFHVCMHKTNGNFYCQLYKGIDRSYAQTDNTYVIFSPDFENIMNSDFYESNIDYKNVCLVGGEEEGSDKTTEVAGDSYLSGLSRREMYYSAGSVSKTTEDKELTPEEYKAKLLEEGEKALKDHRMTKEFEGEVETSKSFVYGKDFYMGDIVEITNEYDQESRVRIKEFIMNQDDSGYKAYPTFEDAVEYGRLPTAYQEVTEIRANKAAYIDTGLKGINGFDISFSNRDTTDCAVFGAKDNGVIEDAVQWALGIAADDTHGYSQYSRWGPDYDCSSFVISAYEYAGVPLRAAGASYTGDMYNSFRSCGFNDVTGNVNLINGSGLKRGDVLLYHESGNIGHTLISLGIVNGKQQIVHARADERNSIEGFVPGDNNGQEICTGDYYYSSEHPWQYVLRYTGSGADGNKAEFSLIAKNGYIYAIPDALTTSGTIDTSKQIVAVNGDSSVKRNIKYGSNTLWAPYLGETKKHNAIAADLRTFSTENSHLIFAERDQDGSVINKANICIQHARFFKSNTSKLVMDLVPCYRKSDGVIGMYDLCGNVCPLTGTAFFINAGTGSFTKGSDVKR